MISRTTQRNIQLHNNGGTLARISPRAIALAYLGTIFGPADPKKPIESIQNWLREFPKDIIRPFRSAVRELKTVPESDLKEIIRHPYPKELVTDFLGALLLREESHDEAKRRGAVFTPAWLARRVTRIAYKNWFRLHRGGKPPAVIADVACGPGAFLAASEECFRGDNTKIVGIDIDPRSLEFARLLAFVMSAKWELRCEDTLLNPKVTVPLLSFPKTNGDSNFDILVGNPPFVRSQLLSQTYGAGIRLAYPTTQKGNFDLSIAFIEHAIKTLSEGGIAAYVLTNKFMTSAYGRSICQKLANEVRVLSLDDFYDRQIFQGYTTYTCVLCFAKKAPAKRFLVTRFPNGLNVGNDQLSVRTISLPTSRLGHHPWDFASNDVNDVLCKLRDDRNPLLGEVFGNILQGLRTGANQVFVIEADKTQEIESEILLPFINGEHIRRCSVQADRLKLIYPYNINEFGEPVLLSEANLRATFPKCWSYLMRMRPTLEDRSMDRNSPWYAYSRSQNLLLPRLRKLLVREMMPRAEFAADISGEFGFASGYGLDASRMSDNDLKMWTAVLCSAPMEFALRYHGTQLQSGWFRLLKHHLRRVRLPYLGKKDFEQVQRLTNEIWESPEDAEALGRLDALISKVFGLSEKDQQLIREFLKDCHERSIGRGSSSKVKFQKAFEHEIKDNYQPVRLEEYNCFHRERTDLQKLVTFVPNKTLPVHRWYRYSQGFSAEVVEFLLKDLGVPKSGIVLDPFVGCGTTNVVCRRKSIDSVGIEISPLMVWVARTKTHDWDADKLNEVVKQTALPKPMKCKNRSYQRSPFVEYLTKAFSVGILDQLWTFSNIFDNEGYPPHINMFLKLGLLSIMEDVSQIRKHGSHYRFMLRSESIGLQKLNTPIIRPDADIRPILMERLKMMVNDVRLIGYDKNSHSHIILGNSKQIPLKSASISAIITSPPYLNRNNYISQQKAELAILSLVSTKNEYRQLVKRTFRSHVEANFPRGMPCSEFSEVQKIISGIELSVNNNPKIPYMIAGYFDDLNETLKELKRVVQPGSKIAFIVGNSRWGGIIVPVDHLLCMLGEKIGLGVEKIYVTRYKGNSPQQMKKYGKIPVRESIVILRKK